MVPKETGFCPAQHSTYIKCDEFNSQLRKPECDQICVNLVSKRRAKDTIIPINSRGAFFLIITVLRLKYDGKTIQFSKQLLSQHLKLKNIVYNVTLQDLVSILDQDEGFRVSENDRQIVITKLN